MATEPEGAARLLRSDEEQLERAARVLGGGGAAFIIFVCARPLRKEAIGAIRKHARGRSIPEPVEVGSADEVLAALENVAEAGEGEVLSLLFGAALEETLQALNWHREKLLGKRPVGLWLDGIEALTRLRETAPDAYAFRDMLVLVRGDDGPLPQRHREETPALVEARRRHKRARNPLERTSAAINLANMLEVAGDLQEAEAVARSALERLQARVDATDDTYLLRAQLCRELSSIARAKGSASQALRWYHQGLAEIERVSLSRGMADRVYLLASIAGPSGGHDRPSTDEAMRLARSYGLHPAIFDFALRSACIVALWRGEVSFARSLTKEHEAIERFVPLVNVALMKNVRGRIDDMTGHLSSAESLYRKSIEELVAVGADPVHVASRLASLLRSKGELDVADRVILDACGRTGGNQITAYFRVVHGSESLFWRGEVATALSQMMRTMNEVAAPVCDSLHRWSCEVIASMAANARDCGQLSDEELRRWAMVLEVAQDASTSIAGGNVVPWSEIHFLGIRANVLAQSKETLNEALRLDDEALRRARDACPDLTYERSRVMAEHLLKAGQAEQAMDLLRNVAPVAAERNMLKELALIYAAQVRALVEQGGSPSAVDERMAALEGALKVTGSPRLRAEVFLNLATELPHKTLNPDSLRLAEEAHELFVAMPMPGAEARALEAAGDILLARGRAAEAKRRYIAARARLERYGLNLRVPLLTSKINRLA